MRSLVEYIKEAESNNDVNAFVILKPEFTQYEDEWKQKIENDGWKFVDYKPMTLTSDIANELYIMHKDKDFYDDLCEYMCSGECICASCYKECDDPIENMSSLKDDIRDEWGKDDMKNAMHSSDSLDNVKRERKLIFNY